MLNFFQTAAGDFRYLLNRGYPRRSALQWVGNRYGLTFDERHLLHRGVFSDQDARGRRKKLVAAGKVRNQKLAVDGHNVLITVEAGLSGRPLILGEDGFIRDISGLSGRFRRSEKTDEALGLIFDAIRKMGPRHTLFLFDAPISRSGALAQTVREEMKRWDLPGDAQAVKVPENVLIGFDGVVASSDTVIIDRSRRALDLAGTLLRQRRKLKSLFRTAPHQYPRRCPGLSENLPK